MADNPRIEELRRRVLADPASIAFAALAEEYRRTGNYAEAIETCRVGLLRHPSYLSARVTLGRALMETAQYEDARRELQLVLKSAPENLAAIRGLAEIHERQGSLRESKALIEATVDPQPVPVSAPAAMPAPADVSAGPALAVLNAPAPSVVQQPGSNGDRSEWAMPWQAPDPVPVRDVPVSAAPATAAPIIAMPVLAAAPVIAAPIRIPAPDPAIARLEQFLVAIQSARGSARLSR